MEEEKIARIWFQLLTGILICFVLSFVGLILYLVTFYILIIPLIWGVGWLAWKALDYFVPGWNEDF